MENKSSDNHGKNKVLNKRMIIKFFTIVFGSVGGFILLSSVVVLALFRPSYQSNRVMNTDQGIIVNVSNREQGGIAQHFAVPERTSFLIMGLDDTDVIVRADVVILGVFNRVTNKIDLVSIPRDTLVHLSPANLAYMSEVQRRVPTQTKFSDLFAHGGANHGASILRRHTEEMLGISIDYEVIVNLNAFRAIVDAVGPITMEIPERGFFYTDPDQDLVISIPGGIQHLDGAMAEGVVRYRPNSTGDLGRIDMQQQFMRALFTQTLQRDAIMQNALELISTFIDYVNTDFGVTDAIRYLPFLPRLDASSLSMITLPGTDPRLWDPYSDMYISYVVLDMPEVRAIIDRIFFSSNEVSETDDEMQEDEEIVQSTPEPALNIKVLNGGNQVGAAGRTRDMLVAEGYNVVSIGDYLGNQTQNTRIIVREQGRGNTLRRYFTNSSVQVDANMEASYDVIIIIGDVTV